MNYANKVKITYENEVVLEDSFNDILESENYTIIDHERLGKDIAEIIFENGKTDISIDDIYFSVNDVLSVLRFTIAYEIERHLLNNLGVEVKK